MAALLVVLCALVIAYFAVRALRHQSKRTPRSSTPPDTTSQPAKPEVATGAPAAMLQAAAQERRERHPNFSDAEDLTSLAASRFRVKGTFAYVPDRDRHSVGGHEYWLVREPRNRHDKNAVAVWDATRKVGHISAAKARLFAPELDRIGAVAFRVRGEPPTDRISLFVHLPNIAGVRSYPPVKHASP